MIQPSFWPALERHAKHALIGSTIGERCFQRLLRDEWAEKSPRPVLPSLDGATVIEISTATARPIILKYEWLGTMGRAVHCVGLVLDGELLGVACFGWPGGVESRDICGRDMRGLAICLERGACVHWAPANAASHLVSSACRLIAKRYGYRIFYAYADQDAGEYGTIYQACNWLYIGRGVGRPAHRRREYFAPPDGGAAVASRTLRHRGLKKSVILTQGWRVVYQSAKHKYVWFEGGPRERRALKKALRYPVLPYPKRN